ncbi:MAG: hypothetical protein KF830_18970 [Planctomycetes bacterium]|nr:hypothetical protein [Planctomycetota bacterium]
MPIDFLLTGVIPGDGTPHGVVFPDPAEVAIEQGGLEYVSLATLIELKLAAASARRAGRRAWWTRRRGWWTA